MSPTGHKSSVIKHVLKHVHFIFLTLAFACEQRILVIKTLSPGIKPEKPVLVVSPVGRKTARNR